MLPCSPPATDDERKKSSKFATEFDLKNFPNNPLDCNYFAVVPARHTWDKVKNGWPTQRTRNSIQREEDEN
ncbi:MAG: hypothetical protein ACREOZ_00850 [Gloeomargaritales cyanobacterium]